MMVGEEAIGPRRGSCDLLGNTTPLGDRKAGTFAAKITNDRRDVGQRDHPTTARPHGIPLGPPHAWRSPYRARPASQVGASVHQYYSPLVRSIGRVDSVTDAC